MLKSFNQSDKINFEEMVAELIKLRNSLRKKIDKDSQKFNVVRVFNQLDIISDSLNKLVGEIKTSIEKNN